MYLYNLTLQKPTGISHVISGDPKSQYLIVARGNLLELLRLGKTVNRTIDSKTFGKSGSRRIVPGQYLAVDPKGHAVMIAACEKQKLVYVVNRDSFARLTVSSPLEANKSCTFTYSIICVDCGFDNPIFAAIELDYTEEAQKYVMF